MRVILIQTYVNDYLLDFKWYIHFRNHAEKCVFLDVYFLYYRFIFLNSSNQPESFFGLHIEEGGAEGKKIFSQQD